MTDPATRALYYFSSSDSRLNYQPVWLFISRVGLPASSLFVCPGFYLLPPPPLPPPPSLPVWTPAEKWQQQSKGWNAIKKPKWREEKTFWCSSYSCRRWEDKMKRLHSHICIERATSTNSWAAERVADCGRFKVSCSSYWAPMLAYRDRQRRCISTPAGGWQSHLFPLFTHTPLSPHRPSSHRGPPPRPRLHGDTWPTFWVRQSARRVGSLCTQAAPSTCLSFCAVV